MEMNPNPTPEELAASQHQNMLMSQDPAQQAQYAQMLQAQQQQQQQQQMAGASNYYYNPSYPTAMQYGQFAGIPASTLYPQNGFYMGQGVVPTLDQSGGLESFQVQNPPGVTPPYNIQSPYLPVGASFYMPAGTGMAYMDPYGMMNPAAVPSVAPQPKKQPKKKSRNCC